MYKFRKGRIRHFALATSIIAIIVYSTLVAGFIYPTDAGITTEVLYVFEQQNVTSVTDLRPQDLTPQEFQESAAELPKLILFDFKTWAQVLDVADTLSSGWMSHIMIVFLIESIEGFILLLYYGYLRKEVRQCSVCYKPLRDIEGPSCEVCFVAQYGQDAWDKGTKA